MGLCVRREIICHPRYARLWTNTRAFPLTQAIWESGCSNNNFPRSECAGEEAARFGGTDDDNDEYSQRFKYVPVKSL